MAPDADHPTRTLTRTLWGDLCLDAVACEGSRLIRPKGGAVAGGVRLSKLARPGVHIAFLAVISYIIPGTYIPAARTNTRKTS